MNRLALTIDRLIWDHSISLGKLVNSRWNLIFILHHEIIWFISTILAPHYRYPNRGSFFRSSKSIKSNLLFVDLGIHIESPVLHIIVKTVAICCNLFLNPPLNVSTTHQILILRSNNLITFFLKFTSYSQPKESSSQIYRCQSSCQLSLNNKRNSSLISSTFLVFYLPVQRLI